MSLADEFGQWKQSQPIVQQTPVVQEVAQEETPFWERAKNDLVSTVSNYIEGAKQGINELSRAQDATSGNDLAQITSEQGYQPPTTEQQQYLADAQKAVMDETVLPTLAFNPATTLPAVGTMLMGGAKSTYDNTEGDTLDKAGNAVRAITYGPAVDMYNDPNLAQRFYDRPVTTLTEGALVTGQALLPIVGAKRGIAKAGEFKTDLARMVDEKINSITDNPPLENIGIRGLDALDQIDSPTRGFRPATPDEAIQYNVEQRSNQGQNLVQALEQLKQQKFDQTEGIAPEPRFPERQQQQSLVNVLDQLKTQKFDNQEGIINQQRFPEREQQQALLQALERAKQQKFDESNQQAYKVFMERQQAESDALQARKNEIASSVLFSPLDRMQVGADLPVKRTLGGQGKVLGEQPIQSTIINPSQRTAGSIELSNQVKSLKNKIENPLERQQMIKETSKDHLDLVRATEEKMQLKKMLTELEGHKNNYIDEMVQYYESNPGGKGVKQGGLGFDQQGNVVNRFGRESLNPQWYQEYYSEYGSKPSKARLREFAEKQLEGSKENPNGHADFIEIKSMIDNIKGILNNERGSIDASAITEKIKNAGNKLYDSAVSRILNKPERTRYSPRERQNFNPNNPVEYSLNRWDKIYQSMFDDKHPLSKLPDGKDTYYKARIANGKAYGIAEELLKREDIDSLEQILKPVKDDLTGFSEYLEAVHSADQYIMGYKTAMPVEQIQSVIDSATPSMKQAQRKIVKYNNDLLEKLVDGGILTRESVNSMKEKYQNYVPFIRDFSDTDAMETFIKSKGNINVSNPIKKLKGSEREIIDPLESIIKNTYTFTNLAERNKVGQSFAKLAENPEFDNIVIKMDGETTANPKLSQFTVWENGKKQAYQTTPELYRSMASLDAEGTNFVMRMIAAPASLLRAGATLTPDFMARNIVRDAVGAFVNTNGFIPGVDSYKGLKHAIKKDSVYWEWMRDGGGMSTMVGLDRDYLGTTVKQMRTKTIQEKVKTVMNPKTSIELLRNMSEKSELATRIGVYEAAIKRGATPLEAIMESREASMDFGRSGTIGKSINNVTAFFNASLQGTDKMIRTLSNPKTRGRASLNIGLSIVLPSFVTWYMGKDDERIQRLPAWQKDLFWVIPTSGKGAGWDGLIRIPKPFEVGVFFGSGTERMLDWAYKNNPNAFKGYGESVKGAITPSLIPTALIPLAEWWGNKSYFSGQDIVPRREQGLPDKYQYGVNTSETAKTIGSITNTSPRKIDNTIRGYTGGLGTKITDGIDLVGETIGMINKNAPAKPITTLPVISGFTATSYRNSQPMQDYYDAQKTADQSLAESKLKGEKTDKIQQQNHIILTNSNKAMEAMHKEQRKIESDNRLTPDQKRAKLDDLQLRETKLAEAVLKKLKK